MVHLESGIPVDLFVRGESAFDRSESDRARPQAIGTETKRRIVVKSAEDTILRKLPWPRNDWEGSERQGADVAGIVLVPTCWSALRVIAHPARPEERPRVPAGAAAFP